METLFELLFLVVNLLFLTLIAPNDSFQNSNNLSD
jgi:hypothetical protein